MDCVLGSGTAEFLWDQYQVPGSCTWYTVTVHPVTEACSSLRLLSSNLFSGAGDIIAGTSFSFAVVGICGIRVIDSLLLLSESSTTHPPTYWMRHLFVLLLLLTSHKTASAFVVRVSSSTHIRSHSKSISKKNHKKRHFLIYKHYYQSVTTPRSSSIPSTMSNKENIMDCLDNQVRDEYERENEERKQKKLLLTNVFLLSSSSMFVNIFVMYIHLYIYIYLYIYI